MMQCPKCGKMVWYDPESGDYMCTCGWTSPVKVVVAKSPPVSSDEIDAKYSISWSAHKKEVKLYDCTKRDGKSIMSVEDGVIMLRFRDGFGRDWKVAGVSNVRVMR